MATFTPKINLPKPVPNVETDWAFRLNEGLDILDDAMLTTNVSGVGNITITDDGSGNVTISGAATSVFGADHSELNNLDFANAGHTGFASSADTDALAASGVATDANVVSVSGHLQGNIDSIDASVTLQEAYDNGDGTIASTTAKPVQTGDLTATGTVIFQDSTTEGNPSFSFAGDPDTGIFHSGGDALKFTTGGTSRFTIATDKILAKVPYLTFRTTGQTIPDYSFKGDEDTGMYIPSADVLGFTAGGTKTVTVSGKNDNTDGVGIVGNLTVTGTVGADSGTFDTGLTVSGIPVSLADAEGLQNIVEDLTPQLGGDLDTNGKNILIADGSAGSPSIQFASDPDTGIARQGDDAILFVTGGDSFIVFTSDNLFLLPQIVSNPGSVSAPQFSFLSSADTGMYLPVVGSLAFSTGGVTAGRFDGSQNFHANADVLASGTVSGTAGSFGGPVNIFGGESDLTMGDGNSDDKPQILGHPNSAGGQAAFSFVGDLDTGMYRHSANIIRFACGVSEGGGVPLHLAATEVKILTTLKLNTGGGSAAAPVLAFNSDPNTGIYQDTADTIEFTTGGTRAGFFDESQNLRVTNTVSGTDFKAEDGTASNPAYSFTGADIDSGMWLESNNNLRLGVGGGTKISCESTQVRIWDNMRLAIGTVGDPSQSWANDTNTGLYQNTAGDNSLAFATDGTRAGFFDANQNLHVTNDVLASGTVSGTIGIYDDGLTVSGVPVATGTVVDEGQIVFLAQMFG